MINLLEKGNQYDIFGLVENVIENSKNSNVFITISDVTGKISGVLWSSSLTNYPFLKVGKIVKIRTKIKEYNGELQLDIQKTKDNKNYQIREVKKEDNLDISTIMEVNNAISIDKIKKITSTIDDDNCKKITKHILKELDKNKYMGASLYYKNQYGGLIEYIGNLLELSLPIIQMYSLNKNLMLTGIMCLAYGKMNYASYDETTGKFIELTKKGLLYGESELSSRLLHDLVNTLKLKDFEEMEDCLTSMLISFKFEESWGALQKPMFFEAQILHFITQVETQMSLMQENSPEKGEFIMFNKDFFGRTTYTPNI